MPRKFDIPIIGTQFKHWVVIDNVLKPISKRLIHQKYPSNIKVKCSSCGHEKFIPISELRSGKYIDCTFCTRKLPFVEPKVKVGQRIGKWIIVSKEIKRHIKSGCYLILVKCNTCSAQSYRTLDKIKNVGCGKCYQTKRKRFVGDLSITHFNRIKFGTKERKLKFTITPEYVWELFLKQKQRCALSGMILFFNTTEKNFRKRSQLTTASLDRIDSKKGYVIGNVQWVHRDINMMKQAFTQTEFIHFCHLISKHNKDNKWSK